MTDDELIAKIEKILIEKIVEEPPDGAIGPDENLFTKGYVSSLQLLDLVVHLEEAFSVSIPHYEVSPENFETLGRLASYLRTKIG